MGSECKETAARFGQGEARTCIHSRGMANKPDKIALHLRRFWKLL